MSKKSKSTADEPTRVIHCRVPIAIYEEVRKRSAMETKPKLELFVRRIVEEWLEDHPIEKSEEEES